MLPRLLLILSFVPFLLLPAGSAVAIAVSAATSPPATAQTMGHAMGVETLLESRIAVLAGGGTLAMRGVRIREGATLREFYTRRAFQPAWTDPAAIEALLRAIRASTLEGLDPNEYHLDAVLALKPLLTATPRNVFAQADAELVFSDALARLARHYAFGKVNPATLETTWNIRAPDADRDGAQVLERLVGPALETGLAAELPDHALYRLARAELVRLRMIAAKGGWPSVPAGDTLKPGQRDARIALLRQRLVAGGDLAAQDDLPDPEHYDEALLDAVQRFQKRHGLATDGAVGRQTLEQLNTPAEARIDTLRVNLDRARTLMRALPERFLIVNIAGFHVYLVDGGRLLWQARAMVGQRYRETPMFRSEITYLQWNPDWTVPPGIIAKDILPKARRDAAHIDRKGLKVIDRDGRVLNPRGIDWSAFRSGNIPYTLRQPPGPDNALGRVKFMFPNAHMVYLHDTPSRNLFDRDDRTFSSGCVRVEDPLTLARLLIDDPAWDEARIASVIEGGKTENLVLRKRVPVLLAYWTAWVEPDGSLQLRKDVYGRDARWLAALDRHE